MAESAPATKKVSTSETGHAKNVANFGKACSVVEGYGSLYNPTVASITLAALRTQKTGLDGVMVKYTIAVMPFKNAVNRRQEGFDGMDKLTTRAMNALLVVGTAREIADARGMVAKIKGGGKKLKAEDAADAAKPRSTSQRSYDMRVDNFRAFVAFLAGVPAYKPNEAALQIASLNQYIGTLPALSENVNKTAAVLANARAERNKLLYAPGTGAVPVSVKVKAYVRSLYGAASPEYKRFAKIELRSQKV